MKLSLSQVKKKITWRHILYFLALNVAWPSTFSFQGWLPEFHKGLLMVTLFSMIAALTAKRKKVPTVISIMILAQMTSFVLYCIFFNDTSYITRCMQLVITWCLIALMSSQKKQEFIDTYIGWISLQAIMGAIGFVLVIIGILPVISTFREFDGHTGNFYGLFTTTVTYDTGLRVAGFFDEPGAFACWGVFALLYNKLFIDNERIEKILVIGLISTLSMAYFIQVSMYFILFYRKNLPKLIIVGFAFFILIYIVSSLSPEINTAIFGRFQFDESTGHLAGNNRYYLEERCLKIWKTSPIFGVGGYGLITLSDQVGFVGANAYTYFAMDGIFGQLVLWIPTIYLFYKGMSIRSYFYAAIIIVLGYYQRPYDPTQLHYPLIVYTICWMANKRCFHYNLDSDLLSKNERTSMLA